MRSVLLGFVLGLFTGLTADRPYYDRSHDSRVFGEPRTYRVFLPLNHAESGKRYPVIYYFHGHSDRYTLEDVSQGGLRISTRRRTPEGPSAACAQVNLKTAPLYRPGVNYRVFDYEIGRGTTKTREALADAAGRPSIRSDCGAHEFGFKGPGATPPEDLRAELSSTYPAVEVLKSKKLKNIPATGAADLGPAFRVRFVAGESDFARARLELKLTFDGYDEARRRIDVLIALEKPGAAKPGEQAAWHRAKVFARLSSSTNTICSDGK